MAAEISPISVFLSSAMCAAFAGLAALLRSGNPINVRSVLSSLTNSGLLGLAVSLLWYLQFKDNIFFLIGASVIAGLGGATTVEAAIKVFSARFNLGQAPKEEPKNEDK